jgi:mRNA interferase RelE/StbE
MIATSILVLYLVGLPLMLFYYLGSVQRRQLLLSHPWVWLAIPLWPIVLILLAVFRIGELIEQRKGSKRIAEEKRRKSKRIGELRQQASELFREASDETEEPPLSAAEFDALEQGITELEEDAWLRVAGYSECLERYWRDGIDPEDYLAEIRETRAPFSAKLYPQLERVEDTWYIGFSSDFIKSIKNVDKKMQGRILAALTEITRKPCSPTGDTIKPLTGNRNGMWRYRIGDYRLIYQPEESGRVVVLLTFASRGDAY